MSALIRDVGDRALLVELPGLDHVLGLAAALRAAPPRGTVDIVPATRTVLVTFTDRAAARSAAEVIRRTEASSGAASDSGAEVIIDTVYDGPDLLATSELIGISPEALIEAHSSGSWTAAFGGFAPGFAYLTGGDPRLNVPRLSSPRTAVPAGSVAIAGGFSAVYPGESPGGWRLLGRTDARLWDVSRASPALIEPGAKVRFRPVPASIDVSGTTARASLDAIDAEDTLAAADVDADEAAAAASASAFTIVDPGFLALVEDGGRPGRAAIGVTASGALDRGSLARANAAVGNPPHAAGIESLNGGLVIEANGPIVVAVSGAPGSIEILRSGASPDPDPGPDPDTGTGTDADSEGDAQAEAPIALRQGDRLRLGPPNTGLRRYLAVGGGIVGDEELGAAAHDSLSGLGTPPLVRGSRIAVGEPSLAYEVAQEHSGSVTTGAATAAVPGGVHVLRFVPGPRDDWFTETSRVGFGARQWTVTAQSNRIGIRLDAAHGEPPIEREVHGELPTEGTVAGSIQIPPSGLPVLFLADRPVTGGYPVIGTVIDADLDLAAQVRPGERIRFQAVDPDDIAPRDIDQGDIEAREIGVHEGDPRDFEHEGDPGDTSSAPRPATVSLTLEADGRRIGVRIPGALAAALDRLVSEHSAESSEATIAAILAPIVRESRLASD